MKSLYKIKPGMAAMLGIGASLSAAWPFQAAAVQADYGLGYSTVLSNNIGRTRLDRQSEWMNVASGLLSLRELTSSIDAHVYSQLQYRQFTNGTYDNGFLLALDSAGTYTISPKRLSLTATDTFTQAPIDPTLSLAPSNQQNVNTFSAGPDATLQLSPVDDFLVGGRYSNVYFQTSLLNSSRYSGYVRLAHKFDPVVTASLNYEPSRVLFQDQSVVPDYTRHDVFARLAFAWPTNALSIDAGRTRMVPDTGATIQGTLVRGTFTRTINSTNSYSISAGQDLSDSGVGALIANPAFDGASPVPINTSEFVVGGLFRARTADAAFLHHRTYGDDHLHLFWHKYDYQTAPVLNQRLAGSVLDIGHDVNAAISGSVFGDYVRTDYDNAPRTDIDRGIGAQAIYRLNRALALTFELMYSNRSSTLFSQNFNETRGVVTLSYSRNPTTTPNNPFLNYVNPIYR